MERNAYGLHTCTFLLKFVCCLLDFHLLQGKPWNKVICGQRSPVFTFIIIIIIIMSISRALFHVKHAQLR